MIVPKNTNLVEDIEIFLAVKFIEFCSAVTREVKNVSTNQRPGQSALISDQPFRSAVSDKKPKCEKITTT